MGIFGDLDLEQYEDDPWKIKPDVYEATVTAVETKANKGNTGNFLVLTYTIQSGPNSKQTIQEWKGIPQPADPKNPTPEDARKGSFLKQRLISLGVPLSRLNSVDTDDLVGVDVYITVGENKQGFPQVNKVELRTGAMTGAVTGSNGSSGGNPFANFG